MISLEHFGAPAFIVARQADQRFVYEQVNAAATRLTGLDPAKLAGLGPRDIFGEEIGLRIEGNYSACLDRQAVVEFERTVPLLQRNAFTRTTLTPIFDVLGEPATRLLGVTLDITEQTRLQQQLRRSEARLALAVEALEGAHWYYDIASQEFELGSGFSRMLGPSTPRTMSLAEWTGRVHPDDRSDTCFDAIVAGQISCGANEFRVFSDTCEIRWLSCKRRAVVEDGQVVGVVGIVVDITTAKRRELALSRQAATDPLTGLANRRRLDEILEAERERAAERHQPLSLLMIDVDHFKRYNDLYGHLAGDLALKQVAACLKDSVSSCGGVAARFGGEEFTIVLPGMSTGDAALVAGAVLDRVRALDQPHEGSPIRKLSVSIGVAGHPRLTRRAKVDFIALADAALYRAKDDGRNCYRVGVAPQMKLVRADTAA